MDYASGSQGVGFQRDYVFSVPGILKMIELVNKSLIAHDDSIFRPSLVLRLIGTDLGRCSTRYRRLQWTSRFLHIRHHIRAHHHIDDIPTGYAEREKLLHSDPMAIDCKRRA